jgi:hypothetical protein
MRRPRRETLLAAGRAEGVSGTQNTKELLKKFGKSISNYAMLKEMLEKHV